MKFGRYLKDHAIDEWRRKYISYGLLKKQVRKAQQSVESQILQSSDRRSRSLSQGQQQQQHRHIRSDSTGSATGRGGQQKEWEETSYGGSLDDIEEDGGPIGGLGFDSGGSGVIAGGGGGRVGGGYPPSILGSGSSAGGRRRSKRGSKDEDWIADDKDPEIEATDEDEAASSTKRKDEESRLESPSPTKLRFDPGPVHVSRPPPLATVESGNTGILSTFSEAEEIGQSRQGSRPSNALPPIGGAQTQTSLSHKPSRLSRSFIPPSPPAPSRSDSQDKNLDRSQQEQLPSPSPALPSDLQPSNMFSTAAPLPTSGIGKTPSFWGSRSHPHPHHHHENSTARERDTGIESRMEGSQQQQDQVRDGDKDKSQPYHPPGTGNSDLTAAASTVVDPRASGSHDDGDDANSGINKPPLKQLPSQQQQQQRPEGQSLTRVSGTDQNVLHPGPLVRTQTGGSARSEASSFFAGIRDLPGRGSQALMRTLKERRNRSQTLMSMPGAGAGGGGSGGGTAGGAESARRSRYRFPANLPLPRLIPLLSLQEKQFFTLLDRELDKVNTFYIEREEEAEARFNVLKEQLEELEKRRTEWKEYHGRHRHYRSSFASPFHTGKSILRPISSALPVAMPSIPPLSSIAAQLKANDTPTQDPSHSRRISELSDKDGNGGPTEAEAYATAVTAQGSKNSEDVGNGFGKRKRTIGYEIDGLPNNGESNGNGGQAAAKEQKAKPEDYKTAKRKLKEAVFEYYQFLGMLRSYKELNRTGFSKILKKFEKNLQIPCSNFYLRTKVDQCEFVVSTRISKLSEETVDCFAKFFANGSRKKAIERLRVLGSRKMHHFNTWKSGVMFGASIPLLLEGFVKSFSHKTRQEIPYTPALLQIFGAEFLPIFFTMLFQLDLLAWNRARINYVLIFEFDIRTMIDFRQFSEVPALLFFLCSLCFWLAFSNFWPDSIPPHTYPMVWIVLAALVMFNPFPIFQRSARWWLIRSVGRVITAGAYPVAFRDFFLGDQLTSLYYCIYNIGFLICIYHAHWTGLPPRCNTNSTWTTAILSALPNLWRFGQSLRRWVDSHGNKIHLLNAGKYSTGIIYYFTYLNWRMAGSTRGSEFAIWIVFGLLNASYTCAWDLLMDWNLFKRDTKRPFLRKELAYSNHIWFYYWAIISDILARFAWVVYIPNSPTFSTQVRGYTAAILEILRRWQWNILRVESEHIGNSDGYRVTRDVPLPYSIPKRAEEADEEDDEDPVATSEKMLSIWRKIQQSIPSFIPRFGNDNVDAQVEEEMPGAYPKAPSPLMPGLARTRSGKNRNPQVSDSSAESTPPSGDEEEEDEGGQSTRLGKKARITL